MLLCFNDVSYSMKWEKFNAAEITEIRLMLIELCFVVVQNHDIAPARQGCGTVPSTSIGRKVHWIDLIQTFKASQLNAQRSDFSYFCIVGIRSFCSINFTIKSYDYMWCLSTGQQMQQVQYSVGGGAERCRASQPAAKTAELSACKASNHHSFMRNDRIWIILASLDFVQFIV